MELLLIRHGQAKRIGIDGIAADADRTLTASGTQRIKNAADALNKLDIRLAALLTSPYPRAVQTAETLQARLKHKPQVRTTEALRPGTSVDAILKEVRRNAELRSIALCGHEPDLSRTVTQLLSGSENPCLIFHTGSIASLHVDLNGQSPIASLHWFLDSTQLDLIARASDTGR